NDKDDEEEGSDDEQASDEEEFIHPSLSTHAKEETRDEESFDPILKTLENIDDEGNGEENLGTNVGREEGHDKEEEEDKLYRDVNINRGRGKESIFETTSQMAVHIPISVAPLPMSTPTLSPSTISTITTTQQAPTPPTTAPSTRQQDLLDFNEEPSAGSDWGSKRRREEKEPESVSASHKKATRYAGKSTQGSKSQKTSASKYATAEEPMQTTFEIEEPSCPEFEAGADDQPIVEPFQHPEWFSQQKKPPTLDRDWNKTLLRNEAQAENDEFLKTIDENMQNIIKEQVKEQLKVQVSKILPKIKQTMNEQLKAEVLTRSSNSLKTSYAVDADLSEMELKKILIEKIEDTYEDTITLKRRRDDDADKDEEPSAGSDWGSKRRREEKEPESASASHEKATRCVGKSTQGSKSQKTSASEYATAEEPMQTTFEMEELSCPEFEAGADDQPVVEPFQHPEWFSQQKKPPTLDRDWKQMSASESAYAEEPMQTTCQIEEPPHPVFETGTDDQQIVQTSQHPEWFSQPRKPPSPDRQQYAHNLLQPLPLIPNNRGHRVIPFEHFINNDLEYLRG
nr:hypothetical protein [Tanacetum cinerariifolium]